MDIDLTKNKMTLYRHKEDGLLYILSHVILDVKHLNRNAFAGISSKSYKHRTYNFKDNSKHEIHSKDYAECMAFVNKHYTPVSYV